jgi:hypothetical protein
MKKLYTIQMLRGIASFLVIGSHLRWLLDRNIPYQAFIHRLYNNHLLEVCLFFVISGFIISISTKEVIYSVKTAKNFLFSRFIKIIPAYYFCTLVYGFLYFKTALIKNPVYLTALIKSLLFVTFPTTIHAFLDEGAPILPPGWTLNYEIYFYIVFAISLLFGRHRLKVLLIWFLATLILLPYLSTGEVSLNSLHKYNFSVYYFNLVSNPIIYHFLTGIFIGRLYLSSFIIKRQTAKMLFILSGIIFAAFYIINPFTEYGSLINLFPTTFLVFSAVMLEKTGVVFVPKLLVTLGNISYSLYIVHFIYLEIFQHFLQFTKNAIVLYSLATLSSLVTAYAMWWVFEYKLNNWLRMKLVK